MDQERGSAKLIRERLGAEVFSERSLETIIDALQSQQVEILDFFPLGTIDPDGVFGTIRVQPDNVGDVLQGLLKVPGARLRFDVFPRGIINIDAIDINFRTPGLR